MSRRCAPTAADLIGQLTAVKLMVAGMQGAMPSLAAELRREACESIDDIIQDLGTLGSANRSRT